MSEKVWVKWKNDDNNWSVTKVTNLAADADVDDLRKAFVMQQNLRISPGRLSVSLGAEGEVLEEDGLLQPYFVRILQGKAGPGQSKTTALLVTGTDQPPQPQDHGTSNFQSEIVDELRGLKRKLDKSEMILQTLQKSDAATPQYSAALVGNREKNRLISDGNFHIFEGKRGSASVLTAEQVELLSRTENDHQVVAYMAPFLEDIVKDTVSCSVFNSEEYKWIQTSNSTSIYNEKPDLIISHPAFINSKLPFNCNDEKLQQMRSNSDLKYGVLSQWKLRDFIGLTCEAKQGIDSGAFGEVINYGAHICFGAHRATMTRLLLFDKQSFWLVESVRGTVASVTTSQWLDHGSKDLLRNFVRKPALPKLLNDACGHFNLTVASDSFLGAGAFGFVFRAQRKGRLFALKIVLKPNVERLQTEKSKIIRAKNTCPDEVIGLEEEGFQIFEDGAALLMSTVGRPFTELDPQSIVESLQRLHNSGIVHGDARLENVVCVDGEPRWIDFADSDLLLDAPLLMQREMNALIGYVTEQFDGYN